MYNRTNPTIKSDSYTEDKGYNPKHRQTEGGYNAYNRGEQPITYWTKKKILEEILNKLQELNKKTNSKEKYVVARTLNYAEKTVPNYIAELKRLSHEELKSIFLQFTGIHYTGNYYRYTRFFGVSEKAIIKNICEMYKPPVPVQLMLKF